MNSAVRKKARLREREVAQYDNITVDFRNTIGYNKDQLIMILKNRRLLCTKGRREIKKWSEV